MTNVTEAEATATKNTNGELIFTDTVKIGHVKRDMPKAEKLLNDFYKQTTETLGELSLEQIKDLPTDGTQVIKKELKSRYQFPKADDKFNLEALGIDPSAAYEMYTPKKWKSYKFKFTGGKFVLLPDQDQTEITKHHHYANTPEKVKAVKLIKDLLELTDALKEVGLTSRDKESYLFDLLYDSPITREKQGLGAGLSPIVLNSSGFPDIFKRLNKKK